MDANKLIIGARYKYRMLGGKEMELTYTGNLGDERYVFHCKTRMYRFVLGPEAVEDRVTEYK